MAVASPWVAALTETYGGAQVEDLLLGTCLQDWGEQLGFGIHVVRGAVSQSKAAELMVALERSVANAAVISARHVEVKENPGFRGRQTRKSRVAWKPSISGFCFGYGPGILGSRNPEIQGSPQNPAFPGLSQIASKLWIPWFSGQVAGLR